MKHNDDDDDSFADKNADDAIADNNDDDDDDDDNDDDNDDDDDDVGLVITHDASNDAKDLLQSPHKPPQNLGQFPRTQLIIWQQTITVHLPCQHALATVRNIQRSAHKHTKRPDVAVDGELAVVQAFKRHVTKRHLRSTLHLVVGVLARDLQEYSRLLESVMSLLVSN